MWCIYALKHIQHNFDTSPSRRFCSDICARLCLCVGVCMCVSVKIGPFSYAYYLQRDA